MCNFIEDYLKNPSAAISDAIRKVRETAVPDQSYEEIAYRHIATPEFRLYEEMIFCTSEDGRPSVSIRPLA